jgi:hypothetical protein
MDVNRMSPPAGSILQDPVLYSATLRFRKNTVRRPISPRHAIDHPFATLTFELEVVGDGLLVRRKVDVAKLGWQLSVIRRVRDGVADDKPHDLISVEIGIYVGDVCVTLKSDVLIAIRGKVEDYLSALSNGCVELGRVDWVQEQSAVGSYDFHVRSRAGGGLEVQLPGA